MNDAYRTYGIGSPAEAIQTVIGTLETRIEEAKESVASHEKYAEEARQDVVELTGMLSDWTVADQAVGELLIVTPLPPEEQAD